LISVFLIALSGGYYLGGRLADRYPSQVLLHSICAGVALLIFVIALFAHDTCGWLVGCGLGERSGPLVASMLLFLPPSVGLGIVSPFAIRLATASVDSVGKISGTVYAVSTMGSIAGTLLTTFALVPLIGLTAILKGLALLLLLASVLTLPVWKRVELLAGTAAVAMLACVCLFSPAPLRTPLRPNDVVVLDVDTPYHHISVIDNGDMRQMRFDRYIESAIRKTPPYPCVLGYTKYFHLPFLAQPETRRSLFIGAGGGVGPRAFHMHDPEMLIDVVDIDPKVLEIARTHFALRDTANIRTIAEDGRRFVQKTDPQYDCVVVDAFTTGGRIPFHLVTTEFLTRCRDKMSSNGVFVININSAIEGPTARIFHSMHRTMEAVFPHTYVFAKDFRTLGTHKTINIILVATKSPQPIGPEQWKARAERHESNSYVTRGDMQRMVADLLVRIPDTSRAPVFTDDFAPIETMPF
jgi:spermidine synthase